MELLNDDKIDILNFSFKPLYNLRHEGNIDP